MPKKKNIFFPLLAITAGIAVGGLLFEVTFQLFNITPPILIPKRKIFLTDKSGEYHCYAANKNGDLTHYSDFSRLKMDGWYLQIEVSPPERIPNERIVETPWCSEIRINRYGMRVFDPDEEPVGGEDKILVVGDSFVYGDGVPFEKSLPVLLAKHLAPDYKTISVGKSGLNTKQEVELAFQYSALLNVQKIVLVFIPNDIHVTPALERENENINDLILFKSSMFQGDPGKSNLFMRSRIAQFVTTYALLYQVKKKTIQWYLDSYDVSRNRQGLFDLQHDFFELANRKGVEPALVIYPFIEGFDSTYPFSSIHKTVSEMAERVGLPVLDLMPAFKGEEPEKLWVYDSDHHPNGKANGIAARRIAQWLQKLWNL